MESAEAAPVADPEPARDHPNPWMNYVRRSTEGVKKPPSLAELSASWAQLSQNEKEEYRAAADAATAAMPAPLAAPVFSPECTPFQIGDDHSPVS
eukprot:9238659-Lingulodinium_polyedra.AAC.1